LAVARAKGSKTWCCEVEDTLQFLTAMTLRNAGKQVRKIEISRNFAVMEIGDSARLVGLATRVRRAVSYTLNKSPWDVCYAVIFTEI
jgi:hypothetical protein